ncbi:AMP-binding protein [Candidatus Poribacteria bacterium]|nr:AMP-binding protein [Candidatus Poribacteria bacterium]
MPALPQRVIQNQTLIALMRQTFHRLGQKCAITFLRKGVLDTSLSFHQLDKDSDSIARSFIEMGVRKGTRVAMLLPKCVYWVVAQFALQKIGAINVPLNPAFKANEVEYLLKETEPRLVVVGINQEELIRTIEPGLRRYCVDPEESYKSPSYSDEAPILRGIEEPGLQDPAIIVFTSGTTGRPKGAVLTQGNLSHDAQNVVGIWEISPEDSFCHALPLFHVHGLCFGLHTSLLAGATTVMLDSFDPKVVLDILSREETTMFMAVPTMYSKLVESHPKAKVDYSHLRLLTSGSAPLLTKDFERIKMTFGREPVEREGMTETLMNFSNPLRGNRKPGSIGLPLPYLQVRIVNPDTFEDVQPGQVGEIWLKGPGITPGYWQNPEETERAFKDGWFKTGDLGRKDEDGYYSLTDRIKNIIITGGENVSPKEVEMIINEHSDVVESSVVGIPDDTWGEVVVAAVVVKHGVHLAPEALKSMCKERLLNWKCPQRILIVSELPKNRMGKVLRDEVKQLFM